MFQESDLYFCRRLREREDVFCVKSVEETSEARGDLFRRAGVPWRVLTSFGEPSDFFTSRLSSLLESFEDNSREIEEPRRKARQIASCFFWTGHGFQACRSQERTRKKVNLLAEYPRFSQ